MIILFINNCTHFQLPWLFVWFQLASRKFCWVAWVKHCHHVLLPLSPSMARDQDGADFLPALLPMVHIVSPAPLCPHLLGPPGMEQLAIKLFHQKKKWSTASKCWFVWGNIEVCTLSQLPLKTGSPNLWLFLPNWPRKQWKQSLFWGLNLTCVSLSNLFNCTHKERICSSTFHPVYKTQNLLKNHWVKTVDPSWAWISKLRNSFHYPGSIH